MHSPTLAPPCPPQVLYNDNAVAGEAAGIALGLVSLGSGHERAEDMLSYARVTQHEKIVRGLGLGLALLMFGREEGADGLIEQMSLDQDAILRYAAMQTIGLAYVGTANPGAIQKLLHFGCVVGYVLKRLHFGAC